MSDERWVIKMRDTCHYFTGQHRRFCDWSPRQCDALQFGSRRAAYAERDVAWAKMAKVVRLPGGEA